MPKVSVIMPVYNAQTTVARAINSIKNQTWSDFELILVDDGSTDDSLSICQEFASQDSRIQVAHQQNQGPSAARNLGMKLISGEFLMCVDADDVLHSDAMEKLLKKMKGTTVDVCIFSWNRISENGVVKPHIFDKKEMTEDLGSLFSQILKGNYRSGGGNPWNKIWRLEAFSEECGIVSFDESIQIYEDMLWTLQNLSRVKKVAFEEEPLYDYYIINSSISRCGNPVEKKKKFYYGAKRVYQYVSVYHGEVEPDAKLWYRNRFRWYLKAKRKNSETLTCEEKDELKSFSVFPTKGERIKDWVAFFIEKAYWTCIKN